MNARIVSAVWYPGVPRCSTSWRTIQSIHGVCEDIMLCGTLHPCLYTCQERRWDMGRGAGFERPLVLKAIVNRRCASLRVHADAEQTEWVMAANGCWTQKLQPRRQVSHHPTISRYGLHVLATWIAALRA